MPFCQIQNQGKPFLLHYQLNGSGHKRLLFIQGMYVSLYGWQDQTTYFSSRDYTVLTFDNRGTGHSQTPPFNQSLFGYTVKEMAQDVIELLAHVGWTRDIHLCGFSLGGMVAITLCNSSKIFASLCLTSTNAAGRLPPSSLLFDFPKMVASGSILPSLFSKEFLSKPAPSNFAPLHTKVVAKNYVMKHVVEDSQAGRQKLTLPPTHTGLWGQLFAATNFCISDAELLMINQNCGKVLILCGDADRVVNWQESARIAKVLGAKLKIFPGVGHGITEEIKELYNSDLENFIESE